MATGCHRLTTRLSERDHSVAQPVPTHGAYDLRGERPDHQFLRIFITLPAKALLQVVVKEVG
jgi:hypothetical protein